MDREGLGIAGLAKETKRDRIITRASLMTSPLARAGTSEFSEESLSRLESVDSISRSEFAGLLPSDSQAPIWPTRLMLGSSLAGQSEFRAQQLETLALHGTHGEPTAMYNGSIDRQTHVPLALQDPQLSPERGFSLHGMDDLTSASTSSVEGYLEETNGKFECDQFVQMIEEDSGFLVKRGVAVIEQLQENAGQNSRSMDAIFELQHNAEDDHNLREFLGVNSISEIDLLSQMPFPRSVMQHPQGTMKMHHKRPKVLSSQRSGMESSQGISALVSMGSVRNSPIHEEGDQESSGVSSDSLFSWQNEAQEPMDSDDGGSEEGDDNSDNGEDDDNGSGVKTNESRMDLTDDLLHMIFSFLNQTALCNAAMVCRQWRCASGHEEFWRSLDFEGHKVSHEQVRRLCGRYPRAVDLNLKGILHADELVREAMTSLMFLEKLTLGEGALSDSFFSALENGCQGLQQLTITDAVLGSGSSQEVQFHHHSLRRLQVTKCRVMRMAIRCPQLDALSLKRTSMASVMLHCPRLLSLDASSCHKLSDAGVRAAVTACPSLISLDISQCSYVSDETLREISAACSNLRVLHASYCPNISLEGVRIPMLTELKLHNCEGINSSSMTALSHCFMLETIQLDFCLLLTAVNLDLPRLQNISLVGCRKFVDLTLCSPFLVNINMQTCPALNRVDISSTALQKLLLQKQQSLTTIALQCPRLREVDLTECDSLTNSICEVFSEGGGCPRLNTLILENCEGLTMVRLTSTSLKILSLVGCRKISSIELACPDLQQLCLDGCDHLTTATLTPVGLQSLNLGICPRLAKLKIEAPHMISLDLKGCGVLSQADIQCPQLLSLDAFYCSHLEDSCLEATTTACPFIQSLILASCPSIGSAGLSALKKLSNLTTLDLSYTFLTDLSPIFETCPHLKILRLLACKYLGDAALVALYDGKTLPDLRELDLSYGSLGQAALEGVLVYCSHLTHVSLNGCANLYDLDWENKPSLNKHLCGDASMEDVLHVEMNSQLQDYLIDEGGLKENVHFQKTHIAAIDQEPSCSVEHAFMTEGWTHSSSSEGTETEWHINVGNYDLHMGSIHALQQLNCVGCPNIKKVVIPSSAGCVHLSSLNLSLSSNVNEVRLSCYNLTSLNLSNCISLEELKLTCPRLISLSLQASGIEAGVLECALQGCRSLETLDVRNCSKISSVALSRLRSLCPKLKRLVKT
eukprot:c26967_g1_i1 orf=641-4252(-)